jgi:hypothetical protein
MGERIMYRTSASKSRPSPDGRRPGCGRRSRSPRRRLRDHDRPHRRRLPRPQGLASPPRRSPPRRLSPRRRLGRRRRKPTPLGTGPGRPNLARHTHPACPRHSLERTSPGTEVGEACTVTGGLSAWRSCRRLSPRPGAGRGDHVHPHLHILRRATPPTLVAELGAPDRKDLPGRSARLLSLRPEDADRRLPHRPALDPKGSRPPGLRPPEEAKRPPPREFLASPSRGRVGGCRQTGQSEGAMATRRARSRG